MENNRKKTILVSRTIPMQDFFFILIQIRKKYPQYEINLLLQENLVDEYPQVNEYTYVEISSGIYYYGQDNNDLLAKLKKKRIDIFFIASNNPDFNGYGEFLKLGFNCNIKNIYLVTKNMQILKIKKSIYLLKKIWKFFVHLILILYLFLQICFFMIILPFLWIRKILILKKLKWSK